MNVAHDKTENMLKELEEKIAKEYKQASKEVQASMLEYLDEFVEEDKIQSALFAQGKITEAEFKKWRTDNLILTQNWVNLRDDLSRTYQHANEVASGLIRDNSIDVYALNYNYGTYQVETMAKINTSFALYNRDTVKRLLTQNPKLLPEPGKKVAKAIKSGKLKRWNQKQIQSVMTQAVLQGESILKIADRLARTVGEKNMHSAIRNARTMTTSAENGGTLDSFKRAEQMGIKMDKQWMATHDGRTRHSHAAMDGEIVPVNEEFSNGLMFPADPSGDPREIYNCRCTIVGNLSEIKYAEESKIEPSFADMDFEEWMEWHE